MTAARSRTASVAVLLLSVLLAVPAFGAARSKSRRTVRTKSRATAHRSWRGTKSTSPTFASAIVVDDDGAVLFEKAPDEPRAPASLTKMMTELITLELVERGLHSWDETVVVPPEVRQVGGSRVRLRPGERISLEEAVHAMVIASANDAAVAVACHLAGSVDHFVRLMNQRARELGMTSTHYQTVHGLDRADLPGSITTARDQSILARALIRHPLALQINSTVADTIRGQQIIHTTNRLLGRCEGVDGLKTGYTGKAGFCLVSTALRGDLRVISVLMGAASNRRRFSESEQLLTQVFSKYQKVSVIRKGQDLGRSLAVLGGSPPQVRVVAGEDAAVVLPVSEPREIRLRMDIPATLEAPVAEGKPLGHLQVLIGDSLAAEVPAVAAREVSQSGAIQRLGTRFD